MPFGNGEGQLHTADWPLLSMLFSGALQGLPLQAPAEERYSPLQRELLEGLASRRVSRE